MNLESHIFSRLIKIQDENRLKEFYKNAYGGKHILNNPIYHDWQFKNNPFNRLDSKSIVIIENKDTIYAHLGLFPVELKVFDSVKNATWFLPYYVLEKYRVLGLGFFIMNFAEKIFDFTMALNVSDDSRKIFAKNGWSNFGNINRWIVILNKNRVIKHLKRDLKCKPVEIIKESKFNFKRIYSLDESYDRFWREVKSRYPITINRKREYINWRYLNHPLTDYHFLVLYDKEKIVGYVVLRFEDNNEELKAARIVDLIIMNDYEVHLLQEIIRYCNDRIDFIDFFFSGDFYKKSLNSVGFFNNNDWKVNLTTVFNPIDHNRKSDVEFLYKHNQEDSNSLKLNDVNNWYIVKGDSDQDRAY